MIANLTNKQQLKLKSPIKDINEGLIEIKNEFDPFHLIFHSGLQLVNYFSNRITFHSPKSSDDKDLFAYSAKLDNTFRILQTAPANIAVITDGSVKSNGSAAVATHI